MEIDWSLRAGDFIRLAFGIVGLAGLFLAYGQLRLAQRNSGENAKSTTARFVLDLNQWFTDNKAEKAFFYRLDYSSHENAFQFDAEHFPHSDDELLLDTLLYKLSHVGALLRRDVVSLEDLQWVRFFVKAVMENPEVHKYLRWLKTSDQVPDHSGFTDAIFLYGQLFGKRRDAYNELKHYFS